MNTKHCNEQGQSLYKASELEHVIDLRHNYPILDTQLPILSSYVQRLGSELTNSSLQLPPWGGDFEDRDVAARWLCAGNSQSVLACSSGNHALSVLVLGLKLAGKIVVAEDFTYSGFKTLASMFNIHLQPCATDDHGLIPEALNEICRKLPVAGLLVQPTIHNPTCHTMPLSRRQQIINVLQPFNFPIIEDDAYRFLHVTPPPRITDLAPDRTIFISSLAKIFSPTLKVAYLLVPIKYEKEIESAIRITSSGTSKLLTKLASQLISDEQIDRIIANKRLEAIRRQAIMCDIFHDASWTSHPTAYHAWLKLPYPLIADVVRDDLGLKGIDVSSGTEFASPGIYGNDAIRISLAAENDIERLKKGLSVIDSVIST